MEALKLTSPSFEQRATSLEAWRNVSQYLSKSRRRVLERVINSGGCTASEVDLALGSPSAHKRLSELERMGLVSSAETKTCAVTGNRAIKWTAVALPTFKPLAKAKKPSAACVATFVAELKAGEELRPLSAAALKVVAWLGGGR